MIAGLQVLSDSGWLPVGASSRPPAIGESQLFRFRGLPKGARLQIGDVVETADDGGRAAISMVANPTLSGHVGLVRVVVDGVACGEVEVVPDKISETAYQRLRAELERTWIGLLYDSEGLARRAARPPTPEQLWQRISRPVYSIADNPRNRIEPQEDLLSAQRIRRPSEIRGATLKAYGTGRLVRVRHPALSMDTAENALVTDTLRRLQAYARRYDDGAGIAHAAGAAIQRLPFRASKSLSTGVPWGVRSDPRYRQVFEVARALRSPEALLTEGPGEARLGVVALPRLYEYWVFLQVLIEAVRVYGPPLEPGFGTLATKVGTGRLRLELTRGTTVRFPGEISVGFEPEITQDGAGWMNLRYLPSLLEGYHQTKGTPDVVVLRKGRNPTMLVLDAKYIGASWVERSAAETHAKYARVTLGGKPIVTNVVILHPHSGRQEQWAGFGHASLVPGQTWPAIDLPAPQFDPPVEVDLRRATDDAPISVTVEGDSAPGAFSRNVSESETAVGPPLVPHEDATLRKAPASLQALAIRDRGAPRTLAGQLASLVSAEVVGPVVVVADQTWMRKTIGEGRIDLSDLATKAARGRTIRRRCIPMANVPGLSRLGAAAEHRGWVVEWVDPPERSAIVGALEAMVRRFVKRGERVVLVSGDEMLVERLRDVSESIEVFDDLGQVARSG